MAQASVFKEKTPLEKGATQSGGPDIRIRKPGVQKVGEVGVVIISRGKGPPLSSLSITELCTALPDVRRRLLNCV